MYKVMRVTENATKEVYWLDGHSYAEAHDAFGGGIQVEYLFTTLVPVSQEDSGTYTPPRTATIPEPE